MRLCEYDDRPERHYFEKYRSPKHSTAAHDDVGRMAGVDYIHVCVLTFQPSVLNDLTCAQHRKAVVREEILE